MKYYAVTEDPRELYHYGVKGMKWGQHIFGDKPKSPGYHKAVKKLKSLSTKAAKATAKSVSTVGQTVKKSAQQMLYNARAAQQSRFDKAIERSQKRYDKIDQKIENYYANKPVRDAKKQAAVNSVKQGVSAVASFIRKTPGQIAYTARKHEENRYQKAVQKAQDRNKLSDALRGLDKEEKLIKQVNRDRKMEELREKHADIMADNDLKTMQKAVKVEKNMPKYYQEARTGQLKYGKLSDEQIGRLQNRLALEANTRRLGSTEEPSWREQKKQARRQGYLQGITKGVSAGMEEVARAGVQYGIRNLVNRKKMDAASELKAEREKNANRIKNTKTRKEVREDVKNEAYENSVREGDNVFARMDARFNTTAGRARLVNAQNERKFLKEEAHKNVSEENKFLREENQNARRDERQTLQRLSEQQSKADKIGESIHKYGIAAIPVFNKDGKQTGTKLLDEHDTEGASYLKLYKARHKEEATAYEKEQKQARDKAERQAQAEKDARERADRLREAERKAAEDRAKKDAEEQQKLANERAEKQRQRDAKSQWAAEKDAEREAENRMHRENLDRRKAIYREKQADEAAAAYRARQEAKAVGERYTSYASNPPYAKTVKRRNVPMHTIDDPSKLFNMENHAPYSVHPHSSTKRGKGKKRG